VVWVKLYRSTRNVALSITTAIVLGVLVLNSMPAPAQASVSAILTTSMVPSKPEQAVAAGYPGASVGYNSTLSSPQRVLVFGSVLNQLGQTVSISVQIAVIPSNGSITFFFSVPTTNHGNYTVVIFATTPDLVPLSVSSHIQVQV